MLFEQFEGAVDLVAEINLVGLNHPPLVVGVNFGDFQIFFGGHPILIGFGLARGIGGKSQVLFRADELIFEMADVSYDIGDKFSGAAQWTQILESVYGKKALSQIYNLFGLGQYLKIRAKPGFERVVAQDAVAESVKGRYPSIDIAIGHQLVNPCFHLAGGFIGESEGKDAGRRDFLLANEPGDAACHNCSFSRAGAGHYQERPLTKSDRSLLFSI